MENQTIINIFDQLVFAERCVIKLDAGTRYYIPSKHLMLTITDRGILLTDENPELPLLSPL